MNYGLYLAASGASSAMARQNVLSNNLANVSTVGFKPDFIGTRFRQSARVEDNLMWMDSNALLEQLGGGVFPTQTMISLAQGPLRATDDPLDLAIEGEGFLMVDHGGEPALTRDGRLAVMPDGTLVHSSDGAAVLDTSGAPIRVDRTLPIEVAEDGRIKQGGTVVAQLAVVDVPDASQLTKGGDGTFKFNDVVMAQDAAPAEHARLRQGMVEDSAVNPIEALNAITGASRAAQGNMRMISAMWDVMGMAVNRLGRVN